MQDQELEQENLPEGQVMSFDRATAEVHKWLGYKQISDKKKEDNRENIEVLVNAVMDGSATIDEKFVITQTLKFPLKSEDGSTSITELKYQPRVDKGTVNKKMEGMKVSIGGIATAYGSAATGRSTGIINKIDSGSYDSDVLHAIVAFFL